MLEQEVPQNLIEKVVTVFDYEYDIDDSRDLYLFTWAPNPADLPDCAFDLQHDYCVPVIASFLSYCSLGLACVESTQMGNPHYHGWYQLSDDTTKEKLRICTVKLMNRLGMLKITKSKGHYRKYTWHNHANCLFYYKKDCIQAMLSTNNNPITSCSKSTYDFNRSGHLFVKPGRQSVDDIEKSISLYKFYEQFYQDLNP